VRWVSGHTHFAVNVGGRILCHFASVDSASSTESRNNHTSGWNSKLLFCCARVWKSNYSM